MTERDLYWVAGILEGEGSFTVTRSGKQPTVKVTMVDEDIIRRLQSTTGMGRVYGPYVKKTPRQDVWEWVVYRKDEARELMQLVAPIMGQRRSRNISQLLLVNYTPLA